MDTFLCYAVMIGSAIGIWECFRRMPSNAISYCVPIALVFVIVHTASLFGLILSLTLPTLMKGM